MVGKVLNVGSDEKLLQLRTAILRQAGYEVTPASNLHEVIQACQEQDFDVVVLGHCIPRQEKKRIVVTVREACPPATPVLGLYRISPAETDDADRPIDGQRPEELINALRELLQPQIPETRAT